MGNELINCFWSESSWESQALYIYSRKSKLQNSFNLKKKKKYATMALMRSYSP